MSQPFPHVTILGGGLLGGSLAMALAKLDNPPSVHLWSRRTETTAAALALGITGATSDLAEAIKSADLLVLCVPVGAMPTLLETAISCGLPDHCLITDVGSVKQMPHDTLRPILTNHPQPFIGSHPMAGSEQGGIQSAAADLFQGAACLLTNDNNAPTDTADALDAFWQHVGCRTTWLSATDHDALVARISHLPHIVAAAAAHICFASPNDCDFAGGGLRDTTRVAGGHPQMWTEILLENRQSIVGPLRDTISELQTFLATLESADQEATRQWLVTAKDRRDLLNPPS